MGKLFRTSDSLTEMFNKEFERVGLASYGISLEVMSTVKSKNPVKVSKANSTTEYLTNTNDIICIEVYEAVMDRISEDIQKLVVEMFISSISYDSEKDKINIQTNPIQLLFNMSRKYGHDVVDKIESIYLAIQQIEDEEKQEKESKKQKKKKF